MGRWSTLSMLFALVLVVACASDGRLDVQRLPDGGPVSLGDDGRIRGDARRARRMRVPNRDASAPIELRTRSGASLPVAALSVRGFDQDPLSMTELRVTFDRSEPRSTAGEFSAQLPAGARVVRFAVGHEGRWREAQVTARQPEHTKTEAAVPSIDTALGWKDESRRFVAHLPHVPARGPVSVVLSYVQTNRTAADTYRVSLRGMSRVGAFDARVIRHDPSAPGTPLVHEVSHQNWLPEDLVVEREVNRVTGVSHGDLAVMRVAALHHDHHAAMRGLTILFDTSASRALGFDDQVDQLRELLSALGDRVGHDLRVRLVAFDQTSETVFEGELGDLDDDVYGMLRSRRALGASDLAAAMYYVGLRRGAEFDRLLLVSDGQITAGRSGEAWLATAAERLRGAGFARLDVLVDDTRRDERSLEALVRALPQRGLVLEPSREQARQLSQRMLRSVSSLKITVPDALWSYPETVDDAQAADEILVYAQLPARRHGARRSVTVSFSDDVHPQPWTRRVTVRDVEAGLVDDAVAAARVESLENALWRASGLPALYRQKYWAQIVDLSRRHRILNDFTALSVPRDGTPRGDVGPMLVAGPSTVMQVLPTDPEVESEDGTVVAVPVLPSPPLTAQQLLVLADGEEDERVDRLADPPLEATAVAEPAPLIGGPEDDARELVASMRRDVQLAIDDVDARRRDRIDRNRRSIRTLERGVGLGGAPRRDPVDAYTGNLLAVMNLLRWEEVEQAEHLAVAWREAEPRSVLAVVALGEALEASSRDDAAARAYGSIIDLYPDRADMRRFAGARLEGLDRAGQRLAVDSYRIARSQDFGDLDNHRRLAYGLLREGHPDRAFEVLAAAITRSLRSPELAPEDKLLREDLGLIGAAWIAAEPGRRRHVLTRLSQVGCVLESEPSLRFVLSWETSGQDVDLHIRDGMGGHAYYDNPSLASGGLLYGDGKGRSGTEALTISGAPSGYPYRLEAHVHATGADGFGSGRLQVIEHDGRGGLVFSQRPFVVSRDRAFVDLGVVEGPLREAAVASR